MGRSQTTRVTLLLLILFLARVSVASAVVLESAPAEVEKPKISELFTRLPSHWRIWLDETFARENAPALAGVLGMSAVQVVSDFESWQAARMPFLLDESFKRHNTLGVSVGDGYFQFMLAGAFLGRATVVKDRVALRTAAQITEAILATGLVVQIIKHSTGRESPFSSETRTGVWRSFPNQVEYHKDFQKFDAVPSGHLSTAMATFIVVEQNYPEQKWIPYIGYPVMAWVGVGLMATSIHWMSDFPIALALGYSFGKIVTRENHRPELAKLSVKGWRPLLYPGFSTDGDPLAMAAWSF